MGWLDIGARVFNVIMQYPFEKHIKADHSKSDKLQEELKSSISAIHLFPTPAPSQREESYPDLEINEIIKREQQGDYCVSCVPSKHLMRAKDALLDALNIANSRGEFTEVAESKLQQAVYELNGAEKDLELAKVPDIVKPAADELHTQIRKLRNFLRQDQSGLELATAFPERYENMKSSLETAHEVNEALIGFGYDIAKAQLRARKEEAEAQYS
jgi:hypothetical protein